MQDSSKSDRLFTFIIDKSSTATKKIREEEKKTDIRERKWHTTDSGM